MLDDHSEDDGGDEDDDEEEDEAPSGPPFRDDESTPLMPAERRFTVSLPSLPLAPPFLLFADSPSSCSPTSPTPNAAEPSVDRRRLLRVCRLPLPLERHASAFSAPSLEQLLRPSRSRLLRLTVLDDDRPYAQLLFHDPIVPERDRVGKGRKKKGVLRAQKEHMHSSRADKAELRD